jgi:hypothetical protein
MHKPEGTNPRRCHLQHQSQLLAGQCSCSICCCCC